MQNKEIVFVASGNISIPPNGYGAVENIIWNYKNLLEKDGYKVKIVNTKNIFKLIKETVFVKNKIIHFHYEPYLIISYILNKIFVRKNKILWTTHNGYISTNNESFFYSILSNIISNFSDSTMISLSELMEKYFFKKGFKGKTYILQNGIDISKFKKVLNPNKNIIYLGNINKNKGQDLFLKYYTLENKIDFIGPYLEKNIDLKNNNYLGIWTKEEVYNNLGKYKVLVLLTKSEGDPLVIKEALSAGCSILTSKIGGVNLQESDFIKIINIENKNDIENINNYLIKLLENNEKYRRDIFNYSENFDWKNIFKEYKKILDEI